MPTKKSKAPSYPRYLVKVVKDKKGNYVKAIYSDTPPKKLATPFETEIPNDGTPFGPKRGS